MTSVYSRFFCFIALMFAGLAFNAHAVDETYQLYSKNGEYYLKADPTWVPISGDIFVIIPVYEDGDVLKLTNSGGSWQVQEVTFAQFNSVNPTQVVDGSVAYSDLNSDGIVDLTVNLGSAASNQYVVLESGASGGFEVRVENYPWAETGGIQADSNLLSVNIPASNFNGPTPGKPSVAGGSASYSVPIALPPGRNQIQPHVSLSYSSRSGSGIAGVGWGLSTAGSISRCPKTEAQDGEMGAIKFSKSNDKLCLNGQRLVNVSGTYGESGTVYHYEMDNFTRVIQKTGSTDSSSTYFEVVSPDGTTSYYGDTPESRISPDGTNKTQSWLLHQTFDVSGKNHISYYYTDFGSGEKLIGKIAYTGDGTDDGNREVRFTYKRNSKPKRQYLWKTSTQSTQILDNIATYFDGNKVSQYTLSYKISEGSGRDLLESLQECGFSNGVMCKDATTFSWSEKQVTRLPSEPDIDPVTKFIPLGFGGGMAYPGEKELFNILPRGDVNGDGVRDWKGIFVNAEGDYIGDSSVVLNPCYKNAFMTTPICNEADFNVDGLSDDWRDYNNRLQIKYTQADGSGTWKTTAITLNKNNSLYDHSDDHIKNVGDYNRDGWPDLMVYRFNDYLSPQLWLYTHTGNSNSPYSGAPSLVYTYPTNPRDPQNFYAINPLTDLQFMGDMNGDGQPDMVLAELPSPGRFDPQFSQPRPLQIWYNQGNGISYTKTNFTYASGTGSLYTYFTYFLDINSDGLPDWLGWREGANNDSILVARLNKGDGQFDNEMTLGGDNFEMTRKIIIIPGDGDLEVVSAKYGNALLISDIDGDGVPEILEPGDRVVEGCSIVLSVAGSNRRCGDSLYGGYRVSEGSQQHSPDTIALVDVANKDDSIYRWNAYHITQDAEGNFALDRKETDFYGHAYQSTMVDAFGKGLPDMVTIHRKKFADHTFETDGSGTVMADHFENYGAYISRNKGAARGNEKYKPHDMLESVSNPNGVSAQWIYRPLSTGEYSRHGKPFYEVDFDYTEQFDVGNGEYFHFASSMYAVAEFKVDNGIGGQNSRYYRYKGAVYNNKGRGFMGFREITEEDPQSEIISTSTFMQTFPYVSRLERHTKHAGGYSDLIEISTNDWVETNAHVHSNTFLVHNQKQVAERYDINETSVRLSKTQVDVEQGNIDKWGNTSLVVTTLEDGEGTSSSGSGTYTTKETKVFAGSEAWPHKLTSTTVEKDYVPSTSVPARHADIAMNKAVSTKIDAWDTTHRKPKTLTVAAGITPLSASSCKGLNLNGCSTTTTVYNAYGSPSSVSASGVVVKGSGDTKSLETRTTNTTYTDDGYFPLTMEVDVDGKVHKTEVETDERSGLAIKTTDANGIVSTTSYDGLWRPTQVVTSGVPTQHMRYRESDSLIDNVLFMVSAYQAGAPASHEYKDQFGRTLRTRTSGFNGEAIYTDVVFDELGRTLRQSTPYSSSPVYTEFSGFDALGRPSTKITPSTEIGEDVTTTYEYEGFVTTINTSVSDGENLTLSRTHNSLGQLVQTTDALGGVTSYAYDAAGNPVVINDAVGNSIFANYDDLGRKTWVRDPNQGYSQFVYNGFGELEKETDANNESMRYELDTLGRMTRRLSPDGNADFVWDTRKLGLLSSESATGVTKNYYYDSLTRPTEVLTQIDSKTYSVKTEYDDNYNRPKAIEYPNDLKVAFEYNDLGYLTHEKNASSGYVYREITDMDDFGNTTASNLSDSQLTGSYLYSSKTGQMLNSRVTKNGVALHYLDYVDYDSYGNIVRQDNLVSGINTTDTFKYDYLHRMTQSSMAGNSGSGAINATINYKYDEVGNMKSKSDYSTASASAYQYQSGTNRLMSVALKSGGSVAFGYDNKGNQTHRNGSPEVSYNVFNKPTSINRLGAQVTLYYDANWSRYKQVRTAAGKTITTHYIDKLYEVEYEGSRETQTSYISDVALVTFEGNSTKIRFTHRDRLGSATTFTDDRGEVTAYRSYDPFGKPKMGNGSFMFSFGISARLANNLQDMDQSTRRGFTDHEHLDEVEIIHMNGRVYDYNVGRFMGVDPFIQEPGNSQSINPYSYIMNNPLWGTDPSGYTGCAASKIQSVCDSMPEHWGGQDDSFTSGKADFTNKNDNGAVLEHITGSSAQEVMDKGSEIEKKGGKLISAKSNMDGTAEATYIYYNKAKKSGGLMDTKFVAGAASAKFAAEAIAASKTATSATQVPIVKLALAAFTLGLIASDLTFNSEAGPQALEEMSANDFSTGLQNELKRSNNDSQLYLFRIGGGQANNLKIKNYEKSLSPPGISLFIGRNAGEVAKLFRAVITSRIGLGLISQERGIQLLTQSKVVGRASLRGIMSTGFSVMPNPTNGFPNHARLTHSNGVEGFSLENRQSLSNQFINVSVP